MTTELKATKPRTGSSDQLLYLVYFIYFFCGLSQCFESVFLPEIKEYFHLNYQQQMYVMFAKNIAFFLAVVVGANIQRIGYRTCLAIAMLLYALGTLLMVPALHMGWYALLLAGFFIVGSGFTVQMVAGNPLLAALGPSDRSSGRLNLGNALGAIAQIIAPVLLTVIIPASVVSAAAKLPYMETIFFSFGLGLTFLCAISWILKKSAPQNEIDIRPDEVVGRVTSVWNHSQVVFGFVAIFLVLGTEAGLFGFFRNYLEAPSIGGLSAHQSETLFTVYLGIFALARLLAAWIQKYLNVSTHILWHIAGAMVCLLLATFAKGVTAIVAVVAIGYFVSIFFPTLYAIATENLGQMMGPASGLLTLGFLGCAVIPVLQGRIADVLGLQRSYGMGMLSYSFALIYVVLFRFRRVESKPALPVTRL